MKLFYYVKTTLKGLVASGAVTLIYFILFPVILAGFLGFVQDMSANDNLKLSKVNVQIMDEDRSDRSKELKEFLASEEVSEVVTLVAEKPDVELIINKGYGEKVASLKQDSLTLNRKTDKLELSTNTLKIILDNYHKGLYVSLAGGDVSKLSEATGQYIIEDILVDKPEKENNFEKMAISMFGFCVTMLLYGLLQSGYADISLNLDRRAKAAPITKIQFLLYESVGALAYSVILLSFYVLFFRITGITFKGSLIDLFLIILLASIFVVAIAKTITSVFGPKIGKVVSFIVFILPILSGEIFGIGANAIAVLTPTHYIGKVLTMYVLNGNLNGTMKWIGFILVTSIVLFAIAIINEAIKGRRRTCA